MTGVFCWSDVMTRDLPGTKALFAKLFGWTYTEQPLPRGTLTLASLAGAPVAALHDLAQDPRGQGVPPHWAVHVRTESADAVAAAVTAGGGRLLAPPQDILDNGRMCAFADPTGAVLCAWQPRKQAGMTAGPRRHGAPAQIELMTTDVERCAAFYPQVFGWTVERRTVGSGQPYVVFRRGADRAAGVLALSPAEAATVPPHWSCYVTVDRVERTITDCVSSGGELVISHEIPGLGRFAVLRTADGVTFKAITWTDRAS